MARPTSLIVFGGHRVPKESIRWVFFVVPAALAFVTSIFILVYVSSTSQIVVISHNTHHLPRTTDHLHHHIIKPAAAIHNIDDHPSSSSSSSSSSRFMTSTVNIYPMINLTHNNINPVSQLVSLDQPQKHQEQLQLPSESPVNHGVHLISKKNFSSPEFEGQQSTKTVMGSNGRHTEVKTALDDHLENSEILLENHHDQHYSAGDHHMNNEDVFHDRDIFMNNYLELNRSMKIFIYPHPRNDPFANVLLSVSYEPGGNYASESYFKKALAKSHFITKDPSKADLFYLPFSIASLRHDKRVGVHGIQDFVKDYIFGISQKYPYWNRTGGADHFYVACHSIGRTAMEKALQVRINAIQVVCSSSYFLPGYIAHKDASVPQIWPRQGVVPNRSPSKRKNLAFYAGALNSRVRENLVQVWRNDSEISVHQNRLKTPYSESLLNSKFCIHAKGYEVNTARIGDALYYGCVPVILADHYDLPFADILNWNSFSVVVSTSDIPLLKTILKRIDMEEYLRLQRNVLKVRKHFQWHNVAVDFDAFYMVMYELWIRRSTVRFTNTLSSLLSKS